MCLPLPLADYFPEFIHGKLQSYYAENVVYRSYYTIVLFWLVTIFEDTCKVCLTTSFKFIS